MQARMAEYACAARTKAGSFRVAPRDIADWAAGYFAEIIIIRERFAMAHARMVC